MPGRAVGPPRPPPDPAPPPPPVAARPGRPRSGCERRDSRRRSGRGSTSRRDVARGGHVVDITLLRWALGSPGRWVGPCGGGGGGGLRLRFRLPPRLRFGLHSGCSPGWLPLQLQPRLRRGSRLRHVGCGGDHRFGTRSGLHRRCRSPNPDHGRHGNGPAELHAAPAAPSAAPPPPVIAGSGPPTASTAVPGPQAVITAIHPGAGSTTARGRGSDPPRQ